MRVACNHSVPAVVAQATKNILEGAGIGVDLYRKHNGLVLRDHGYVAAQMQNLLSLCFCALLTEGASEIEAALV